MGQQSDGVRRGADAQRLIRPRRLGWHNGQPTRTRRSATTRTKHGLCGQKADKWTEVNTSSSLVNYVLAVLTQINNGSNTVTVKARGRAISRAVDVAQVLTKRFATDVRVQGISINTEQVKSTITGGMSNVSSIEIKLGK
ncbi:MAG: DNA-binding protein Alba [Nitrososphaerota archaeon]|nr:DNA-binding protein Alba [Nitrososphaerota archaeon]